MKTLLLSLLAITCLASISCKNEVKIDDEPKDISTKDSIKPTADKEPEKVVERSFTYGIDISKYQGDEMDLLVKKNDSLSFIICRSTEGITYVDPDFKSNWASIKKKGFVRGAYHFYLSDDAPKSQASNFLNAIKDLGDNDLPPIIDFEEMSIAKGANKEQVIENLWQFILLIEEKTGRKPIIYTDVNIGNSYLTAARFANYPLWIADYNGGTAPTMPGAWKGTDWEMWQRTDKYFDHKIQDDFDQFNGDLTKFKAFISSTVLQ